MNWDAAKPTQCNVSAEKKKIILLQRILINAFSKTDQTARCTNCSESSFSVRVILLLLFFFFFFSSFLFCPSPDI